MGNSTRSLLPRCGRGSHWAQRWIIDVDGPFGIGRACRVPGCRWKAFTRKLPAGTAGRGWGMREGNKLRGLAIQHIKESHPELNPNKEG